MLGSFPDIGTAWEPALPSVLIWAGAVIVTGLVAPLIRKLMSLGKLRDEGAQWATAHDLRRAGLLIADRSVPHAVPEPTGGALMRASSAAQRRGRIVIGRTSRRLVAAKQRESVLVFGPPGSGKTSAFAIPNILEWDGPAVVCSVTSEILRTTIRVRSSHGRMAWVYDPTGSVGDVLRVGWDPIPQCADFQKGHPKLAHHLVSLSDLMSVTQG